MSEPSQSDKYGALKRLHEAIRRLAPQFKTQFAPQAWDDIPSAEKDCVAAALEEVFPSAEANIEHPAGNRTNAGDGARAPSQPREVGRTPTRSSGEISKGRDDWDRAEGSGGRVDTANAEIERPDAATRSAPSHALRSEPVAWRYRTRNSVGQWSMWAVVSSLPHQSNYEQEVVPLYEAPPMPSATPSTGCAGAAPDSWEKLVELYAGLPYDIFEPEGEAAMHRNAAINLARGVAAHLEAQARDAARLDFLEREANAEPLVLHSQPGSCMGRLRGLGLACTGRSIRKAIDDMMGRAEKRQ